MRLEHKQKSGVIYVYFILVATLTLEVTYKTLLILDRIIEMNRTTSTLLSLGVSAVLIAVGVRFLYSHSMGIWPKNGQWAMGHHGMMGGGMGIVMIIFWIVLIAAFVLLISGAVNGIRGSKQNKDDAPNPLEILKQRYARDEIDKVEYENKRQDLLI